MAKKYLDLEAQVSKLQTLPQPGKHDEPRNNAEKDERAVPSATIGAPGPSTGSEKGYLPIQYDTRVHGLHGNYIDITSRDDMKVTYPEMRQRLCLESPEHEQAARMIWQFICKSGDVALLYACPPNKIWFADGKQELEYGWDKESNRLGYFTMPTIHEKEQHAAARTAQDAETAAKEARTKLLPWAPTAAVGRMAADVPVNIRSGRVGGIVPVRASPGRIGTLRQISEAVDSPAARCLDAAAELRPIPEMLSVSPRIEGQFMTRRLKRALRSRQRAADHRRAQEAGKRLHSDLVSSPELAAFPAKRCTVLPRGTSHSACVPSPTAPSSSISCLPATARAEHSDAAKRGRSALVSELAGNATYQVNN